MDFSTWFRNTYERSKKVFSSTDMRKAYEAGQNPSRADALRIIEQAQDNFRKTAKEKAMKRIVD